MEQRERPGQGTAERFEDPSPVHAVLTEPRLAWPWLVLRVSVGWVWLEAGWRQLQRATPGSAWPAQITAVGLTLAGIALILGAFVGIAALAGGLLGIGLLPAGAGPVAALLFAATIWLVITWKTAGWIGLDRWLLPLLGMPWRGGVLLGGESTEGPRPRVPSPPTALTPLPCHPAGTRPIAMGEGERMVPDPAGTAPLSRCDGRGAGEKQ